MPDTILNFNYPFENDSVFWFCALAGSGMFLIQLLLTSIGLDGDADIEEPIVDAGKFKWLTRQGVTGFLMMFGLSALTCQKEFGLSILLTYLISGCTGFLAIFVTGSIFQMSKKLQSFGDVFTVDALIGQQAIVYQRIKFSEVGKISISFHGFTHEVDAITFDEEEIPSFSRVSIIKKIDSQTVAVTKIIEGNKL